MQTTTSPLRLSRLLASPGQSALPDSLRRAVRVAIPDDVELSRLGRYLGIAAVFGLCALLHAWSRIDLRETAVALDVAQTKLSTANAEQQRLKLELASLRDPARLGQIGVTMYLDTHVPVVAVPAAPQAPQPVEVASR